MKLDKIVPFGRSMDEYIHMFMLTADDLASRIIGVGDGPASFNAEMSGRGKPVVSLDPMYVFKTHEIEQQFYAVLDQIISQIKSSPDDWVWIYHRSPEQLREHRIDVLKRFLEDYDKGRSEGRYLPGELPDFYWDGPEFDIALCSHVLFLYSDHLNYAFHRQSVLSMLSFAKEVRLFPLLTLDLKPSPYLEPLIGELRTMGFSAGVERVRYEFQRGAHEMLRIRKIE